MGDIFGGSGGVSSTGSGGNFTTQGGLTGGGGGGGVIGPIDFQLPPAIQNTLNTTSTGSTGGTPGVQGPGTLGPTSDFSFTQPVGLAPPPGFNAQTGGGDSGLLGLGQSLGQNFTVEQTQQQSQISPEQSGGLSANIQAALQLAANQLNPSSQLSQFLNGPGAALPGQGQQFLDLILQSQQGLLSAEDPSIVQDRIDAVGTDIQQFLAEALGGAGGVGTSGALAGNLGGGRGQVLGGIATRGATDAFAREAAGIRESAAGRRLQALLGGAQAGALGTSAAGDVFNLGLGPSNAAFGPLLNLSQIIGDPQTTQQSLQQKLSQGIQSGEGTGSLLSGAGNLLTGITNAAPGVKKLFDSIFNN